MKGVLVAVLVVSTGCSSPEKTCEDTPGTSAELAATPRPDPNLELLALTVTNTMTAREDVYQRIVADVSAIRAAEPALAHIRYWAGHDGQTLSLVVSDATRRQIDEGRYDAWNCLNKRYGAVEIRTGIVPL